MTRLSHVKVPEGVSYSSQRELKFEFLDNTADIQVHSCFLLYRKRMYRGCYS